MLALSSSGPLFRNRRGRSYILVLDTPTGHCASHRLTSLIGRFYCANPANHANESGFSLPLHQDTIKPPGICSWYIWAALNNDVLRADKGEMRCKWNSAELQWRGKREIPEKTRPAASSGAIPTCENPQHSPPTKLNHWVRFPAGSLPHFRTWVSCRTMPPVGEFSWGSPVSPNLAFWRCSILTSTTSGGREYETYHCARASFSGAERRGSSLRGTRWRASSTLGNAAERCERALQRHKAHAATPPMASSTPASVVRRSRCRVAARGGATIISLTPLPARLSGLHDGVKKGAMFIYFRTAVGVQEGKIKESVAERLACSSPTKAIRVQSSVGSLRIFACGNRAGRCYWSAGFLGDLQFPQPLNSGAAPYSLQSP
ncbi:hypothetical protein PR048_012197 [Dryococelus australis]|uniref:Uncharacterized protein n=1 Tax=Dryococelus australis TaxID=614101 RepID=A0ABQ9HNP2_9NEOP|nr:hypothetical protein PR048_012197 [Dryococelus australis]